MSGRSTKVKETGSARAVADVNAGVILASVEIDAPAAKVFAALTDPKELVRWWGSPETYQTETWEADLRVGGAWKATGRDREGRPYAVEGEFLEVTPPHGLVQTWRYDWGPGAVTTVRYRVEPLGDGQRTRVTVRHEGFAGEPGECEGHTAGWEGVLGWLAGHLEPVAVAPAPKYFFCRLVAARPTFATDMNDAERAAMGAHGAYWREKLAAGKVVVFGPVADPKGPWGLGVVCVTDEHELATFQSNDPAILANVGLSYESLPMIAAVT